MKETSTPVNSTADWIPVKELPCMKYLTIFRPDAPNMVGMAKKNENSVATYLEVPTRMAPKMVAPEREVPGISDRI